MAEVFLGLGGNLGEPARSIERALALLGQRGIAITARSSLYRTPPWGPVPQPDYVNACARGETDLAPHDLLRVTQAVEADLGRVRDIRWGPRAIDVDVLLYGSLSLETPELTLPHPRMTERGFVLLPLTEVAPELIVAGRAVRDWAAACDAQGITRLD